MEDVSEIVRVVVARPGGLLVMVGMLLVSARLLYLRRKNRGIPEALVAGLIGFGALGNAFYLAGNTLHLEGRHVPLLFYLGPIAIGAARLCIAWFAHRVFFPEPQWSLRLVIGISAAVCLTTAMECVRAASGALFPATGTMAVWMLPTLWAAVGAFQGYRRARKQNALGVGNPVVTNRFLLFSVLMGTIAIASTAMFVVHAAGLGLHTGLKIITRPGGVVIAVTTYLTFLPPTAYRRWLHRRQKA
ncbi:MAG: hypothetical protein AAFX94_08300 [Myxococcota bacterium]